MPAITPRKQSKLLLSAALIASSSAFFSSTRAEEDHDHDHDHDHDDHDHEPCQCIAGLSIECTTAMTTTQAALDYLEEHSECKTKANSAECKSNYYVMQAHHDHCPQDKLPKKVKDAFHEFEAFYEDFYVKRQFDSTRSSCPALASCSNALTTDKEIVTEMEDNTCNDDCSSNACKTRFQKMLMYHDTCAEDQMPTRLEQGMHTYEVNCTSHLCNTADGVFTLDTSVCSPAPSVIASSSKFVLGLAGFAAYFLM